MPSLKTLKDAGVGGITLAERSGMGDTREVLEQMGVLGLSRELGFNAVVLDDVDKDGWIKFERGKTHWLNGFLHGKDFP